VDTVLLVAGGFAAIVVLLFLVDRVLPAMEARGWIFWRKTKGHR